METDDYPGYGAKNRFVYLYPLLSAFIISLYFILGELSSSTISPLVSAIFVACIAGVLIVGFALIRYGRGEVIRLIAGYKFYILLVGSFLALAYIFLFWALKLTTAGSVVAFTAIEPVLCIVFASLGLIVAKERLSWRTILCMIGVIVTVMTTKITLSGSFKLHIGWGEVLASLSGLFFALAILFFQTGVAG